MGRTGTRGHGTRLDAQPSEAPTLPHSRHRKDSEKARRKCATGWSELRTQHLEAFVVRQRPGVRLLQRERLGAGAVRGGRSPDRVHRVGSATGAGRRRGQSGARVSAWSEVRHRHLHRDARHDPHWRESVEQMIELVKPGGSADHHTPENRPGTLQLESDGLPRKALDAFLHDQIETTWRIKGWVRDNRRLVVRLRQRRKHRMDCKSAPGRSRAGNHCHHSSRRDSGR